VLQSDPIEIKDYAGIPATPNLVKAEVLSFEETQRLNQKHVPFDFKQDSEENDCEAAIKQMLPALTEVKPTMPKDNPDFDRVSIWISDFDQSYDYSDTAFFRVSQYYQLLERVLTLMLFQTKLSANLTDVITLDHAVKRGLPFWFPDNYKDSLQQSKGAEQQPDPDGSDNEGSLAEKVLNKLVTQKRARANLAEDLSEIATTFRAALEAMLVKSGSVAKLPHEIRPEKAISYMSLFHENLYYLTVNLVEKLIDSYYSKNCAKELKFLTDTHKRLTNRDNSTLTYQHNAFHLSLAAIRAGRVDLGTTHWFYADRRQRADFSSCIQPIINEQALNPPQMTVLQAMYPQNNSHHTGTQFAGQVPYFNGVYSSLGTALIHLPETERVYAASTMTSLKSYFLEYLRTVNKEDAKAGLSLEQLRLVKKAYIESITARNLKTCMICWVANSTLPLDPEVYKQYLQQYQDEVFWKILHKKA
jgi:hypothetical protein